MNNKDQAAPESPVETVAPAIPGSSEPAERAFHSEDTAQPALAPLTEEQLHRFSVAAAEWATASISAPPAHVRNAGETVLKLLEDRRLLVAELERREYGLKSAITGLGKRIVTPCPACGARSLFIGNGGHLTCAHLRCSEPGVERQVERLREDLGALATHVATLREACKLVLELADAEPAARRQLRGLRLLVRQKVEKALAEEVGRG